MHASPIPYPGWRKLPADFSGFETEHFCTLSPKNGAPDSGPAMAGVTTS